MTDRIFLSPPACTGKEMDFIQQVFDSNYIAPAGPMLEHFEREICEYTGYTNAVAVISGTAAIHLALLSIGIKHGDHVWSSSLTFIGGVSPVLLCGGILTFVDSSFKDWNIDLDLLEEELHKANNCNYLPKAIIVTDLYGQACDYDRLYEICEPYEIKIIVDSAESLGATYKNSKCRPKIITYSFNGNKIITSSGGGMIASRDKKIIDFARFLSTQARDQYPYYHHSIVGFNYRMSNILAAIGAAQLKELDIRVLRKKAIYDYYKSKLSSISAIKFMPIIEHGTPNYWLTVILIDTNSGVTPERIRLALDAKNIEARPVWKPMHLQPVFSECEIKRGNISEEIFRTGLCLPSGISLQTKDQDRIIEAIQFCFLHADAVPARIVMSD